MNNIEAIKSALHHWWPQALSKRWINQEGKLFQIFADGKVVHHKNTRGLGAIRNAHTIKLAKTPTGWDQSFENYFDSADSSFPEIIDWVESIKKRTAFNSNIVSLKSRMHLQNAEDEQLDQLLECLLSLVVRSPRFRNAINLTIEYYQQDGMVPTPSSNQTLININLRDSYERFKKSAIGRGKIIFLISEEKEFVFGDGFYHNYTYCGNAPLHPRILVPLTPHICAFYTSSVIGAKVFSMKITNQEVDFVNTTTQIYSRDFLFYSSQKPVLCDDFKCRKFLEYEGNKHPSLEMIESAMH